MASWPIGKQFYCRPEGERPLSRETSRESRVSRLFDFPEKLINHWEPMPCKSWNLLFLRFVCEFYDFQFKRSTFAEDTVPTCDVNLARARLKFNQPSSEFLCLLISLLFHFDGQRNFQYSRECFYHRLYTEKSLDCKKNLIESTHGRKVNGNWQIQRFKRIPNPPRFAANSPVPGTARSFPLFVISIHPGRGEKTSARQTPMTWTHRRLPFSVLCTPRGSSGDRVNERQNECKTVGRKGAKRKKERKKERRRK